MLLLATHGNLFLVPAGPRKRQHITALTVLNPELPGDLSSDKNRVG